MNNQVRNSSGKDDDIPRAMMMFLEALQAMMMFRERNYCDEWGLSTNGDMLVRNDQTDISSSHLKSKHASKYWK
jgi:hypothetical protein